MQNLGEKMKIFSPTYWMVVKVWLSVSAVGPKPPSQFYKAIEARECQQSQAWVSTVYLLCLEQEKLLIERLQFVSYNLTST